VSGPPPTASPGPPLAPSARLQSLWNLIVRGGARGSEHVRAVLLEGARGLAMENASLARLEGEELVVEFAEPLEEAGTRMSLDRSVARAALRRSGTFSVLDTNRDREFSFVAPAIRSFLSAAFRIGAESNAVNRTPRSSGSRTRTRSPRCRIGSRSCDASTKRSRKRMHLPAGRPFCSSTSTASRA
jgi:hypothetical protein